jgi:hypothetical protein
VQRGISALKSCLGEDAACALLEHAPPRKNEAASFYFPLPVDYTGTERHLRIGFPSNFPRGQLSLHVEPSPWLVWPHAMESGLCLHGFQDRPIMGSPEVLVKDSLSRLAKIISLSSMGSDDAGRDSEFRKELTSYWSRQHEKSSQNLILLTKPQKTSELFAISDPRQILPSGREVVWLATDASALAKHYGRTVGKSVKFRDAETPGFYIKLQSYPDIRFPEPKHLLSWLLPHLTSVDAESLESWFQRKGSLPSRWIVLELPGGADAPLYCLDVRSPGQKLGRGTKFGLRSSHRRPATKSDQIPAQIRVSTINVLDRAAIHSRDRSHSVQSLVDTRVVCVGVGSLGGAVALQLARSGVGHLTLIDPETLVSANLGRHVLGANNLGKSKALALREMIRRDLPTAEVDARDTYAEIVQYTEPDIFDKANLVIVTTADWRSEVALWSAKSAGRPWALLQAWSEPHTHVGHALVAPAGNFDARTLFSDTGDFNHKFTEWPDGGVVALPACGESFIPGGSLGMMNIASMVSQTALAALSGGIADASWVSSIYKPEEVSGLGGGYLGPQLPDGAQQLVLSRKWPAACDTEVSG